MILVGPFQLEAFYEIFCSNREEQEAVVCQHEQVSSFQSDSAGACSAFDT